MQGPNNGITHFKHDGKLKLRQITCKNKAVIFLSTEHYKNQNPIDLAVKICRLVYMYRKTR